VGVEFVQLFRERASVLCGEGNVAAAQGFAASEVGHRLAVVTGQLPSAECLVRVVDAGDEVAEVDVWVFSAHEPDQSPAVGDDAAAVGGGALEVVEPGLSFAGGGPA
jgi:hypothetical protein